MDLSKIGRIISIVTAMFSLSAGQEKQLNNYVKYNMLTWQAEMRKEEEIEQYIKAEASRISGKTL